MPYSISSSKVDRHCLRCGKVTTHDRVVEDRDGTKQIFPRSYDVCPCGLKKVID